MYNLKITERGVPTSVKKKQAFLPCATWQLPTEWLVHNCKLYCILLSPLLHFVLVSVLVAGEKKETICAVTETN